MYRDLCMRAGARVPLCVRMLMYAMHVHCTCGAHQHARPQSNVSVRAEKARARVLARRAPAGHWAPRGTCSCYTAAVRLSAVSRPLRGARCSHARDGGGVFAAFLFSAASGRADGAECATRFTAASGCSGGAQFDSGYGVPVYFVNDGRGLRQSGVHPWPAVAPISHREPNI